jgi:Domain of unknown function (DUF4249)
VKKFLPVIILILLASACIREIEIDLPQEPVKVVAIGVFKPGDNFKIKLSFSQPVYESTESNVPDQKTDVTIAENGKFLDRLVRKNNANGEVTWEGDDLVFGETSYSLAVQVPGYPLLRAFSSVPAHKSLVPLRLKDSDITTQKLSDGSLAMVIPLTLTLEGGIIPDKPYFAFNLRQEIEVFEIINGQKVIDRTEEKTAFYFTDGRTFSLLHNIAEPVTLINERFWSEENNTILLNAYIPYDPSKQSPRKIMIEWRTLSEEFYRYHLSIARQGNNQPLSEPDAIFNNILEGYGNFSGYSVSNDTINIPQL